MAGETLFFFFFWSPSDVKPVSFKVRFKGVKCHCRATGDNREMTVIVTVSMGFLYHLQRTPSGQAGSALHSPGVKIMSLGHIFGISPPLCLRSKEHCGSQKADETPFAPFQSS